MTLKVGGEYFDKAGRKYIFRKEHGDGTLVFADATTGAVSARNRDGTHKVDPSGDRNILLNDRPLRNYEEDDKRRSHSTDSKRSTTKTVEHDGVTINVTINL